ncbi:MAG: hypothetical protein ACFFD6_09020 [Candidatus Thorarchaeota archaeon]
MTTGDTPSLSEVHSRKDSILFYIRALFKISKNPFLSRKKDVLFIGGARRVRFEDGIWWDIYRDPIIDKLQSSYVSVEQDFQLKHQRHSKTKNLRYMDFIDVMSEIMKRAGLFKLRLGSKDSQLIRMMEEDIFKRFNVKMNLKVLLVNVLQRRRHRLPLFLALLKRVSPKAIVCDNSYGKEDLIEVAKRLKIPVVELQHGVIYPMHFGYSYPKDYARKLTFPDYLLVFGDYWKDAAEYPIGEGQIVSIGFPYMDIQRKKYALVKKKKQILFISQGGIGNSIAQFAVNLSKEIGDEYRIVFKLHPAEAHNWKERYPELLDANLTIISRKDTTLYRLFAESMIQLGVSSTAIFEGLAFGLRTFLIEAPSVTFLNKLLDSGFALKVESPTEFLSQLEHEEESTSFDTDYFFKKNASTNAVDFLTKLLSNDAA